MTGRRADPETTLREVLRGRFLLGAALNDAQITGQDPSALELVRRHFSTISPENVLKWEVVHPQPDLGVVERGTEEKTLSQDLP